MSWYDLNYACGHTDRMQIYGPTNDRQRQADAESRKLCPNCWRQQQDDRNAAAALAASCDAAAAGLPDLTGSPRQIAWAETIRQTMLAELVPAANTDRTRLAVAEGAHGMIAADDPRWQQLNDYAQALSAGYRRQSSAKWWIDHRTESLARLTNLACGDRAKSLFAPEIEAWRANKAAEVAQQTAAREAEISAARAAKDTAAAISEATASQFVPLRIERLSREDLLIHGDDGHLAKGYQADGDTVVYEIDGVPISSGAKAEALNRRIASLLAGGTHAQ